MRPDPPTPSTSRARIPRPPVPRALAALITPVYGVGVRARNRAFDAGRGVRRVDAPVISVGNLSAGGTGKSPAVLWLASVLASKGYTPGVATRGYKSKAGQTGDEQAEMHRRMPGLMVEADPTRVDGANRLIERGCDVVLLDDGFQHRKLARDLDIVLLDATRPVFADRLLPLGYLRETTESLSRAHVVVITRCESAEPATVAEIEGCALSANASLTVVRAEHRWESLVVDGEDMPAAQVEGMRVVLACGIGNPEAFVANTHSHGAEIISQIIKPDHHEWSASDAARLSDACEASDAELIVTAKDWVKLDKHLPAGRRPFRVVVPRLSIGFTRGESELVDLVLGCAGKESSRAG